MNEIKEINKWNKDAGRTDDYFNIRAVALHTGLQCEELAEKLEACGMHGAAKYLADVGHDLKAGYWDMAVADADQKALIDADCDLMVVTIGSAQAQGVDFELAMQEVIRSNESKRQPDGSLAKNAYGKIIKGPYYSEPDLAPLVNTERRAT